MLLFMLRVDGLAVNLRMAEEGGVNELVGAVVEVASADGLLPVLVVVVVEAAAAAAASALLFIKA